MDFQLQKLKISQLKHRLEELKKEIDNRRIATEEKISTVKFKPSDMITELESKIIDKEKEIKEKSGVVDSLTHEKKLLEIELSRKTTEIREYKEVIINLQRDNQNLISKIEQLEDALKKQTEENKKIKEDKLCLEKKFDHLTNELQIQLQKQLKLKSHEAKSLSEEMNNLVKEFNRWNRTNLGIIKAAIELNQPQIVSQGLDKMNQAFYELLKVYQIPEPLLAHFPISTFIEKFTLEMKTKYPNINLQTKINVEESLLLFSDIAILSQALENIILNSLESRENPTIIISVNRLREDETESIIIKISDNGMGIPQHLIKKVFLPFFTTKENRFGLGLYKVNLLLKLLNGDVSISSEPGKGTDVIISLPL